MNRVHDNYQAYSWHQSHDQATILLLIPYETLDEDVVVAIERHHLVAGVRGQDPILKGRLYGSVDVTNSLWQLEPRNSRLSARERTTSSTSTASTQSSFAVVSDPGISSSFAASLDAGLTSETDDFELASPALSSPISLSADEGGSFPPQGSHRRNNRFTTSHPVSPRQPPVDLSVISSYSSLESLHHESGRLLTIHLEKGESVIWPSLVVGPVPVSMSPCSLTAYPWNSDPSTEVHYNMDPTSMVLLALDLCDIRHQREEAFEYFVRAWHQAHIPSASVRLASHYLPANLNLPGLVASSSSSTPSSSVCSTPTLSHIPQPSDELVTSTLPTPGTPSYYLHHIGGPSSLAQLYVDAGMLHIEGSASTLLSSSYAGLSALRTGSSSYAYVDNSGTSSNTGGVGGSEAWKRDRENARRYFDRARRLDPELDIPLLPSSPEDGASSSSDPEMHSVSANASRTRRRRGSQSGHGDREKDGMQYRMPDPPSHGDEDEKAMRTRRTKKDEEAAIDPNASSTSLVEKRVVHGGDDDGAWYLYLPGLVGAGTALLFVGFLSFSSWRKSQGS